MPESNKVRDVVVVGSFVQDLAFYAESFPRPGESRIGRFAPGPGGKGFNQAIAAHRLGARTVFIGAVGDDPFGESARAFAESEGMETALVIRKGETSGVSSILVDASAQNMIVVDLGANRALPTAEIDARRDLIENASVVLCQTESDLAATLRALTLGRDGGATTILNPAPINEGVGRALLDATDILTPNETEFAFLLKHLVGETLPPEYWHEPGERLHAWCAQLGVPTVVVTLGADGCFVSHHDAPTSGRSARYRKPDATAWSAVPAAAVDAVDTTGAGDAFSGGLAAGLVEFPGDFEAAVRFATLVAGFSTTEPGTAPSMPTRTDIDAFDATIRT